jgi:galactose mutarotase-like enzyme
MIRIESPLLAAAVNPLGAELSILQDADGRDLLHDGDPAFWASRAPLLFPIVGGLKDDRYLLDGTSFTMLRHGVARRQMFEVAEQAGDHVRFRLSDNGETRVAYPFAFQFDAEYRIEGAALTMTLSATNMSETDMPVSLGYHPAFAWPLPYGGDRAAHRIRFDEEEPDTLALLGDGLIVSEDRPSPVEGRDLPLRDDLFEDDALIWRALRSRGCLYGAEAGPQLRVDWSDMPSLGIWTKPGAPYVCIEPWAGIADRADFDGEIWGKPGMQRLAPGESLSHWMRITLLHNS